VIFEAQQLTRLLFNQRLAKDRLKDLQNRKLRRLVKHAFENVAFYRSLFEKAGIKPRDIRSVDDLDRIPLISKDDLTAAGIANCIAKTALQDDCISIKTSGSTGKKFVYHYSKKEEIIRRLIEFRSLLSIGFRPQDQMLVLGPEAPHRKRLHQHLGLFRSENVSALVPSREQIKLLQDMRPNILWCYPSVLEALLQTVDYRLSKILKPEKIITSAESLPNYLRTLLIDDVGAELFNFYGAREVGRIAYECRAHAGLHVNADHLILQMCPVLAEDQGVQLTEAVITCLNAYTMPLIRYKIGDICSRIEQDCPCGCSFPLIGHAIGRTDDMFTLPSGRLVSPIALGFIVRRFAHYRQYRFIQEAESSFLLEIVFDGPVHDRDILALRQQIGAYLAEPVELRVQRVVGFENDGLKFRPFISKIRKSPDLHGAENPPEHQWRWSDDSAMGSE